MIRSIPGRWLTAALASLVTVAASVVLAAMPTYAAPVHRALHATAPVSVAPVRPGFAIEYFGLAARLTGSRLAESGVSPFGEVRFETNGAWAPWRSLGEDGAQGDGTFTSALLSVGRADAYQVRGLPTALAGAKATALNLTDGPTLGRTRTLGASAGAATSCRSRADWNADESITAWTKRTDTPAFSPDQVVTVHHTAGSNDPTQNYSDTVRAIEQYHVLTNGWSDIGYQYLIDPDGVVYEGRYSGHTSTSCLNAGGDGSDFAHRTNDDAVVTGAHVGGYNTGNLGIAILGCFDSQSSTCQPGAYGTNDTTPTPAAMAALEQLLARLATRHGLNSTGSVSYQNSVTTKPGVPSFTGHRDWEATACPGGNVYAQLPTLRTNVRSDIAPTAIQSSATDTAVHLQWSPGAAWPTAPRATRYAVSRDGVVVGTTSALTYDDTGLAPGKSHRYDIAAIANDGSTSSTVTTTTVTTSGTASTSDFTISASPSSAAISASQSASTTVSTTQVGDPSTVQLSASVTPASSAVSTSFGATSIVAGGSTSLMVVTTAAAPAGTYSVVVNGQSLNATHTTTFTLRVTNRAPTASISSASCSGATCTFAGSGADPEGGSVALAWSTSNGSPSTATGPTATAKYSSPGTSTVTLTGTDPAGLAATVTRTVSCSWTKGRAKTLACTVA